MSEKGIILKALSGFYYVFDGNETVTCRARGKFRHLKLTPLVGDRVVYTRL
jgi:ribosome biogenesis GTPase